jgi:hypothetical protein
MTEQDEAAIQSALPLVHENSSIIDDYCGVNGQQIAHVSHLFIGRMFSL